MPLASLLELQNVCLTERLLCKTQVLKLPMTGWRVIVLSIQNNYNLGSICFNYKVDERYSVQFYSSTIDLSRLFCLGQILRLRPATEVGHYCRGAEFTLSVHLY